MRLLKLILTRYTRLKLKDIEVFEFNPTAPTQFIIGTNGSGKSSVVKEYSPLPPEKEDYEEGGGKYASFDLDGVIFKVDSRNEDGHWRHSFIRDGQELNDGGTITVQYQLVRDHFHYTPEIHELLTGENGLRFSKMSAADRRKWFTILPNSNYDYAIGLYKRVTEKYNENRHALKRAKENLTIEMSKLISPQELDQLRDTCSELYTQAQDLIARRSPLIDPSHSYIDRSNRAAEHFGTVAQQAQQLIKRIRKLPSDIPRDEAKLQEAIVESRTILAGLQETSNRHYEDFQRVQKLWEGMQATKLENAAQIQQQLDDCDATIAQAQAETEFEQSAEASITIASCDKLMQWWPNVQSGFDVDGAKGWSRKYLHEVNEDIDKRKHILAQLNTLIGRHEQTVEHHHQHQNEKTVVCPKCDHSFQPNFSELTLKAAQDKLNSLYTQCDKLTQEFNELAEHQVTVQNYLRHRATVLEQLSNYPGLESFTQWIVKNDVLTTAASTLTSHLNRFRDIAGKWQTAELAFKKKKEIQHLAVELLARDTSGDSVETERVRLEALIGEFEFNKSKEQARLEALNNTLTLVASLTKLGRSIENGLEQIDKLHSDAAESLRREIFAEISRELQTQLNIKEAALMAAERQQSVIEHIEEEVRVLTENTENFKILQQELSPTEGIIAEGLNGFMTMYVEQMNKTCGMLWKYPLKILPCTSNGDGLNLNYRFPIIVDKVKRKDVSKGSSGMQQVFDLAFVIAAMKSLGIGSYPLFLDEFGTGLDPVHKRATVSLLESLMELERFEQVILISHDITQYSAIGRSEICVLHDANVILPPNCEFNKHVKFI